MTTVAAFAAAGIEGTLGQAQQLESWALFPICVATGGVVVWVSVAIDTLARRAARPTRADIAEVLERQRENSAKIDAEAARFARAESQLRLLLVEPELLSAERELAGAAQKIEAGVTSRLDLEGWNVAVSRWTALVVALNPEFAPDMAPASAAESQTARERLPATMNLSSQDLRQMLNYLVQRDRITAAHQKLQAYRASISSLPEPEPSLDGAVT